ncbi:MAG: hypothetical protein U5O16_22545 [Rhodococcus sp. (in: high G+C Gram-positive bacteria)]|nr:MULTISPECIES: hypothetical protein [Rhodococcus erythropolis group]MCD2106287.1 hypothetical protein [Rhodococcus qingshengii]MCZ4524713.1 hypothetical protein [Rhodococcus erythropolis]MDZ7914583.1 hypothetical protein [Rhodococcus sp. (in: high G+C Gram-positive bacteria)]
MPADVVGIGWVTTDDEVACTELPTLPGLALLSVQDHVDDDRSAR